MSGASKRPASRSLVAGTEEGATNQQRKKRRGDGGTSGPTQALFPLELLSMASQAHNANVASANSVPCAICGSGFPSVDSLLEHHEANHSNGSAAQRRPQEAAKVASPSGAKRQSSAISEDAIRHTGVGFECNMCQKNFASRQGLQNHVQTVHLKKRTFHCEECNKKFSANGSLKRHIDTVHRGQRKFVCFVCNKSFALKHHLKNHAMTVHQDKDLAMDEEGGPKRRPSAIGKENSLSAMANSAMNPLAALALQDAANAAVARGLSTLSPDEALRLLAHAQADQTRRASLYQNQGLAGLGASLAHRDLSSLSPTREGVGSGAASEASKRLASPILAAATATLLQQPNSQWQTSVLLSALAQAGSAAPLQQQNRDLANVANLASTPVELAILEQILKRNQLLEEQHKQHQQLIAQHQLQQPQQTQNNTMDGEKEKRRNAGGGLNAPPQTTTGGLKTPPARGGPRKGPDLPVVPLSSVVFGKKKGADGKSNSPSSAGSDSPSSLSAISS